MTRRSPIKGRILLLVDLKEEQWPFKPLLLSDRKGKRTKAPKKIIDKLSRIFRN